MANRPVLLCILDGVGLGAGGEDDAVATARTPVLDRIRASNPWMALKAHGTAVGLPSDADMGNSEVGHNAMGAGRVHDQGAKLVNRAIADGSVWVTETWRRLTSAGTLHLIGLVSDGNVHAHTDHLRALIERAAADGVRRLRVHGLTDGRDVGARTALTWFVPLEARLAELTATGLDYAFASGGGRMNLTMDRYEADWSMVARGWSTHVRGVGRLFPSAVVAIQTLYEEDPATDDQRLPAFVIGDGAPNGRVLDGDTVLFFNFRGDRAIEISRAFEDPTLTAFDRGERPNVYYAGMMEYDGDLHVPSHFLVAPPQIDDTVGKRLAGAGLRTFATAETQKFGHVTYFFNGNNSLPPDPALEDWAEVPSDVRPFDEAPWMKAAEVADQMIAALDSGRYDHLRMNFANGDMVGHTGNLEATRIAVEAVDLQLGRVLAAAARASAVCLVTADHGNADEMYMREKGKVQLDEHGAPAPKTSHTLAPVPFILVDPTGRARLRDDLVQPGLASVGSTVLDLCGVAIPKGWAPTLVA